MKFTDLQIPTDHKARYAEALEKFKALIDPQELVDYARYRDVTGVHYSPTQAANAVEDALSHIYHVVHTSAEPISLTVTEGQPPIERWLHTIIFGSGTDTFRLIVSSKRRLPMTTVRLVPMGTFQDDKGKDITWYDFL